MATVSPWLAFGAGLASFFSPCIVPIVPGYVAFLARSAQGRLGRRMLVVAAFVLGFGVAFVALGLLAGLLGSGLGARVPLRWAERVGGALIIAFGLAMTGLLRLRILDRDARYHGPAPGALGPAGGALLLGAAFGVGWSPCVGPILASILLVAGLDASPAQGALLLGVYALGLAVPFLALGLTAERGAALLRRFARASRVIEIVGGVLLILLGIAVFTGQAARLTSYLT